jgi:hypothetical protein
MKKMRGGRALLNLPGHQSTAAIVAEITMEGSSTYPDYTLKISDCSRAVDLELDFDTADSRENNLYKIDTMLDVLKEFRKGVVAHGKRVERAKGND